MTAPRFAVLSMSTAVASRPTATYALRGIVPLAPGDATVNRTEKKRQRLDDVCNRYLRNNRTDLTAGHVMTTDPTCVEAETTVLELVKLFHGKRFRHLLVTDPEGRLVGVVSDRDVIGCFGIDGAPSEEYLSGLCASQLMTPDVISIGRETKLDRLLDWMIGHGISCLPVVEEDRPIGIVTGTDMYLTLQSLLKSLPSAISAQVVSATADSANN